jgi:hypothetical protein
MVLITLSHALLYLFNDSKFDEVEVLSVYKIKLFKYIIKPTGTHVIYENTVVYNVY